MQAAAVVIWKQNQVRVWSANKKLTIRSDASGLLVNRQQRRIE
jgi:hypothetical protein